MHFQKFAKRSLAKGLGLAAAVALLATPALAQDSVASFYKGKTITIYVGFGPGGGYDLYGRLAADHLGKFIPGHPSVIVQNMPGAGGRRAAQYLYKVAPQDGTALAVIVQSVALDSATGAIPGNIDASKYNAVGRLVDNYELGLTWHKSKIKTFDDAKKGEVSFASTGGGSASSFVPKMLNDIEGTKFKVVAGYKGAAAATLAMEQGEVDGSMSGLAGLKSSHPDWLSKPLVNVLWQLSNKPSADYPKVPAVGQMGHTPEQKAMLRLVAGASEVGRSLLATPNVPKERVEALRAAFSKMVANKAFLADANQRHLEINPITGAELQKVIEEQMHTSPQAIAMARKYTVSH